MCRKEAGVLPIKHSVAWAELYLPTKWGLDPSSRLTTTNGPKIGGAVSAFWEEGWAPSNTMWPGPRHTYMPSFILIHPPVWQEYSNVTERTDRQTGR